MVRLFGKPEVEGQDSESQAITFFKDALNVDIKPDEIDISHRVGQRHHNAVSQSTRERDRRVQHRPIIVKFISHKSKVLVMRNKKKLKETNYNMTEDLAPEIYSRLKKIRNLPSINKCWSMDGKIKCQERGVYREDHQE